MENVESGIIEVVERESDIIFCVALIRSRYQCCNPLSLNLKKGDFDATNVKSGVIKVAERESDIIFGVALISKTVSVHYGKSPTAYRPIAYGL